LNQDNIKNIIFDMDAWTAVNGNTGPYLLYAYARTQSVLRKGENVNATQIDLNLLVHDAEKTLLTDLGNFKTMSERSTVQNKPQLICIYLYQLSKNFSRFFENCPVLKAESDTLVSTRLALTRATGKVLKQGLSLLGINTLQRM
jgi:arginyl-tRNA synthetase